MPVVEPLSKIHDANGLLLNAMPGNAFINSSFANTVDRQRMVLQFELSELKSHGTPQGQPKVETITTDRACIQAASDALNFMQVQIDKKPQPTWIAGLQDKSAFNQFMGQLFKAAGQQNGVSPSKMDSAVETYNLRPASLNDISSKAVEVKKYMDQMDELAQTIDKKFDTLAERLPPEQFKKFSSLGITSIDGIYAIDPGYFTPKDGDGRPTGYDPRNVLHNLQAIDAFVSNPGLAEKQGMTLYGPKAIHALSNIINQINEIKLSATLAPPSMQNPSAAPTFAPTAPLRQPT